MSLILKILKTPPNVSMNDTEIHFENGGSIGRGVSNTLALQDPDRYLSSAHALITKNEKTGDFIITDTSTNGVFINGSKKPMGKTNKAPLKSGDILKMGLYEMRVVIDVPTFIKDGTAMVQPKRSSTVDKHIDDLINGMGDLPSNSPVNEPHVAVNPAGDGYDDGFGGHKSSDEMIGLVSEVDPIKAIERMNAGGAASSHMDDVINGGVDPWGGQINDINQNQQMVEPPPPRSPINESIEPPKIKKDDKLDFFSENWGEDSGFESIPQHPSQPAAPNKPASQQVQPSSVDDVDLYIEQAMQKLDAGDPMLGKSSAHAVPDLTPDIAVPVSNVVSEKIVSDNIVPPQPTPAAVANRAKQKSVATPKKGASQQRQQASRAQTGRGQAAQKSAQSRPQQRVEPRMDSVSHEFDEVPVMDKRPNENLLRAHKSSSQDVPEGFDPEVTPMNLPPVDIGDLDFPQEVKPKQRQVKNRPTPQKQANRQAQQQRASQKPQPRRQPVGNNTPLPNSGGEGEFDFEGWGSSEPTPQRNQQSASRQQQGGGRRSKSSPTPIADRLNYQQIQGEDLLLTVLGVDTKYLSKEEKQKTVVEAMVVLREALNGVMGVLAARNAVKSEFRVNMTSIQTHENNPLKFSVSTKDALNNMFVRRDDAYLTSQESVSQAMKDISDHQLALLAGIKLGMKQLVKRFDPEILTRKFEKAGAKGGLMKNKSAVLWEKYLDYYENEVRNDDFFDILFGHEFAQAYEEQLTKLKYSK